MVMDARWKVYVQDRRFDDNQISNMYLKLKWETVGRFSFDFRPMDGDESYMVANNTLRIFWGDLHKLDGVIQRVDWDSTQWCYHIYGADIRGLLLERVNTEERTVHSYPSDVVTTLMYEGCDFPTNVWTGSGENIGRYTFNYRLNIQNTIRTFTGIPGDLKVYPDIDRGTITAFGNEYIEDATKAWGVDRWRDGSCRIINGEYKDSFFKVLSNTANRLVRNGSWETHTATFDVSSVRNPTYVDYTSGTVTGHVTYGSFGLYDTSAHTGNTICPPGYSGHSAKVLRFTDTRSWDYWSPQYVSYTVIVPGTFKYLSGNFGTTVSDLPPNGGTDIYVNGNLLLRFNESDLGVPIGGISRSGIYNCYIGESVHNPTVTITRFHNIAFYGDFETLLCDVVLHETAVGNVPPNLEIGTLFEVCGKNFVVAPAERNPVPVAVLKRDDHIIQTNVTDDLSSRTTSMTVRGTA